MPNGGKNWNELGWAEWKGAVGKSIEILEKSSEEQWGLIREVRDDVLRLKVKMALVGAGSGGVVGAITAAVVELLKAKGS